jgi:hypothetical protein
MMTLLITSSLLLRVRAPQRRMTTAKAFIVPHVWGAVRWEGFLDLIIKLWLMFRSRYLVLWSLGTYGLPETR